MKKCAILLIGTLLSALSQVGIAAASLTDEFDGGKLGANWKWHNEPKVWDVGKTKAAWLTIEADMNRNLWAADDTSRLYLEVPGEPFDVETHLTTKFAANSVVGGLVVFGSKENNWVTIKFWGHAAGDAQLQFQTKQMENGNGLTGRVPDFASAGGVADLYLRLAKSGDDYTAYWKFKEGDKWIAVGPTKFALTPPLQLSLYAGVDAAAGTMTAQYEFFRDNINPLSVTPKSKLAATWGRLKGL